MALALTVLTIILIAIGAHLALTQEWLADLVIGILLIICFVVNLYFLIRLLYALFQLILGG